MTDPIRTRAARLLSFFLPLALAFAAMPAAAAIDPDDLLPVDDAFALRAEAPSADRIEIRWRIADGYYLYRHRIAVQADAGFAAQPLQLPSASCLARWHPSDRAGRHPRRCSAGKTVRAWILEQPGDLG